MSEFSVSLVGEGDLGDLLPLMRAYCDFYEVSPSDESLLAMSRALIADPELEGLQLLARGAEGRPLGFATVFWSWSTLSAARLAVMNDLFVGEAARGAGVADALIEECRRRADERGARSLEWSTARDNHRARAVYERVGGKRDDRWLDYSLETVNPARS